MRYLPARMSPSRTPSVSRASAAIQGAIGPNGRPLKKMSLAQANSLTFVAKPQT
jgi:hypothetical protein